MSLICTTNSIYTRISTNPIYFLLNFFLICTTVDQINNGLDRAIMTMKKGEHALITISADCFSDHEISGKFQANSVLRYEVELIDFIKVIIYIFLS